MTEERVDTDAKQLMLLAQILEQLQEQTRRLGNIGLGVTILALLVLAGIGLALCNAMLW